MGVLLDRVTRIETHSVEQVVVTVSKDPECMTRLLDMARIQARIIESKQMLRALGQPETPSQWATRKADLDRLAEAESAACCDLLLLFDRMLVVLER